MKKFSNLCDKSVHQNVIQKRPHLVHNRNLWPARNNVCPHVCARLGFAYIDLNAFGAHRHGLGVRRGYIAAFVRTTEKNTAYSQLDVASTAFSYATIDSSAFIN
ncbi:hypothetical protein EVAR_38212_1 [Eumeta japonica]|uniref:Uncharacterized protein n=1 Tax=Eumeta variegata TaxID=151549 RepID=A0A4C1XE65_EUMVA|nr:hypothetical protein EVAR_38212_1 [Eumeta japonica]